MEALSETTWDVVLSGTGLTQSLLALALSRSSKKVLHLDKNDFYGGAEAALSLEEAEAWTASINGGGSRNSPFRGAAVQRLEQDASRPTTLGFSRAYSLSLSPQLIYTRSNLLPALVSSKVYRQLEFLAVGSWWIYGSGSNTQGAAQEPNTLAAQDYLRKIPSSREDVVNDTSIDLRSKRNIMRFLQLAADAEAFIPMIEEQGSLPFPEFLSSQFKIPDRLHAPLLGLTLSPDLPKHTSTAYAIPRIQRHLTSTGMFGPGFAAVIPKWGGLAEVTQVACRAGAVGGGVYVLNKAIEEIGDPGINQEERKSQEAETTIKLRLVGDETIQAKRVAGSYHDLPQDSKQIKDDTTTTARSIAIISSPLSKFFSPPAEGAPPPAAAVITFPTGSLSPRYTDSLEDHPPIYLMIHSSDTGECPAGQSVIYAQTFTSSSTSEVGYSLLSRALDALLATLHEEPKAEVLWKMHYSQETPASEPVKSDDRILKTPDIPPSFVLEDNVLHTVQDIWECFVGEDGKGGGFMNFEDREGAGDDEGEQTVF